MKTDQRDLTAWILDALPQAVLIADARGAILTRNAAAETMLPAGDELASVLSLGGAGVLDLSPGASVSATPGDVLHRSVQIAGRGSRRLTVDIQVRRLRGQEGRAGEAPGVLVIVEDVAGRLSMERRLAVAERLAATGKVAARVAHELNNPLDGVLRYVGLAERAAGERLAKYLAGARKGLMRMAQVIAELRRAGGDGGAGGEQQPVAQMLDEAVTAMQPRAQALGVSVICDVIDDGAIRSGGGVFQVFCNVIKNALDAMKSGGMLTIRLRRSRGQCVVEFADTGCGLECEDPEDIFQLFYTTKPLAEGSGLGLAISREILARLGGEVSATQRGEGGTSVTVHLPIDG